MPFLFYLHFISQTFQNIFFKEKIISIFYRRVKSYILQVLHRYIYILQINRHHLYLKQKSQTFLLIKKDLVATCYLLIRSSFCLMFYRIINEEPQTVACILRSYFKNLLKYIFYFTAYVNETYD